ncbi:MAG: hypothetical protein ACOYJC_10695 [Christensenellales bacterium]|jgi:hypothetical protein
MQTRQRPPEQNTTGRGTAFSQNYTSQPFGNEIPFASTADMSGRQMPAGFDDQQLMDTAYDQLPETLANPIYTPGLLRQMIGKWMRVEFLIGNNLTDRVGMLIRVGASYIVLQSLEASSSIVCDIYSIKFVTIVNNPAVAALY